MKQRTVVVLVLVIGIWAVTALYTSWNLMDSFHSQSVQQKHHPVAESQLSPTPSTSTPSTSSSTSNPLPNQTPPPSNLAPGSPEVHGFYYVWWGNPEFDGEYFHWNHEILEKPAGRRYQGSDHDIGASFYPEAGTYSSHDPEIISLHMKQMVNAGIDVVVVSWWGPSGFDGQGEKGAGPGFTDRAVPLLLDGAAAVGLKVAFHLEPIEHGNTIDKVKEHMEYIMKSYGSHEAFYRYPENDLPLFYAYDSYKIPTADWISLLTPSGSRSIRGTALDAVMVGLYVEARDGSRLSREGWDGFYTYFATDGFTAGSTTSAWPRMAKAAEDGSGGAPPLFIPCVGPGYDDIRVRPWNGKNSRDRREGAYYDRMWEAAIKVSPRIVGITSFNEWHEGTQIEPAVPANIPGFKYLDYEPLKPDSYLESTFAWASRLRAAHAEKQAALAQVRTESEDGGESL